MITDAMCPKTDHAPKWYENGEEVGDEKHTFSADSEMSLEIPEAECGGDGAYSLRYAQVGEL
jgi:hypothetical protein